MFVCLLFPEIYRTRRRACHGEKGISFRVRAPPALIITMAIIPCIVARNVDSKLWENPKVNAAAVVDATSFPGQGEI